MKTFLSKHSLLPSKSTTGGSTGKSNQDMANSKTELEEATIEGALHDPKLLTVGSEPSMSKQISKSQGQFDDGILKRAEKSFGGFFKALRNEKDDNQKKKKPNKFSNSLHNMNKMTDDVTSPKTSQANLQKNGTGSFLTLPNLKAPDDQRLSITSYDSSCHSMSQGNLEELSPSPNAQYFHKRREGEKSLDDLSPDVLGYIISFLPSNLEIVKEYYRDSYSQLLEIRKRAKLSMNGKNKIEAINSKQKKALKKLLYSKKEATRSFGVFSLCFTKRYFYEELFERVSFWQSLCEVCNRIDLRSWDSFCQKVDQSHDDKEQIDMWQNIYRYYNEFSARWEIHPDFVHSVFKISQNDLKIKRSSKKSKLNSSHLGHLIEYKDEFKSLLNTGSKKDSLCAISSNSFTPGNLYYIECECKFSSISSRLAIGIMPDTDCFFKEHQDPTAHNMDYSFTSFDDTTSPLKNICRNSLNMAQNISLNLSNVHSPFNPKEYTSPDMLCLSMLENMEDSQLFLSGDKISIIIDYAHTEKNVLKLYYCNNWDSSKERTTFAKSIERIKLYDRTRAEGQFANYLPQNLALQDDKVLNYLIKDEISQIQKECKKNSSTTTTTEDNINQSFEDRISEPFKKYSSRHVYFLSKYRNSTEQNYQYPKGYKSHARREIISFFKVDEKNESSHPIKSLSSAFDPTRERPTICTADLYLPNIKLCMSSQEVGDSVKIVKPSLPYPPFFYHLLSQKE